MFSKLFSRYFSRNEFKTAGGYNDIARIAYPLIMMSASSVVMQFADRKFLANSSTEEMAAALPSGILYYTLFCFFQVTANFTGTIIAQLHGHGNRKDCVTAAWSGLAFAAISGVIIMAVLPFAGHAILSRTLSPTLFPDAWTYFKALLPCGVFVCLSAPLFSFFSGRGKTMPVAVINIGVCLLNVLLDWLLIFGKWGFPRWGIFGAGLATSISAGCGLLAAWWLFRRVRQSSYPTRQCHFKMEYVVKLIKYGTPSGLQVVSDVGSFTLILLIVGRLGDVALAATTIAFSINNLSFLPLLGLSEATAILCGQYIGKRAKKVAAALPYRSWRLALIYMLFTGSCYVLLPDLITAFFQPDNVKTGGIDFAEVARQSRWVLLVAAVWNLMDITKFTFGAALRGAGDTRSVLVINTACAWLVGVPGICFLVFVLQPNIVVIWGYLVLITGLEGALLFWRFRTGKWRKIKLIKAEENAPSPEAMEHMPL